MFVTNKYYQKIALVLSKRALFSFDYQELGKL